MAGQVSLPTMPDGLWGLVDMERGALEQHQYLEHAVALLASQAPVFWVGW